MLVTILTALIQAIPSIVAVTREVLAATLEELAEKVRQGALIPDAAFEQSQKDHQDISDIRDKLDAG